jgi:hypothetical protein
MCTVMGIRNHALDGHGIKLIAGIVLIFMIRCSFKRIARRFICYFFLKKGNLAVAAKWNICRVLSNSMDVVVYCIALSRLHNFDCILYQ